MLTKTLKIILTGFIKSLVGLPEVLMYYCFIMQAGLTCRLNVEQGNPHFNTRQEGLRGKVLSAVFLFSFLIIQNANATWFLQESGVLNDLWGATFINSSTGWVIGDPALIMKTIDGGQTWSQQYIEEFRSSGGGNIGVLRKIIMVDDLTGFVCGHSGVILKTTNGGDSWFVCAPGSSNSYYGGMDNLGSQFIFAAGEGLFYSKTTDGGSSWEQGILPVPGGLFDVYGVDVITTNLIYITGSFHGSPLTPKIYRTVNGGASWNLVYDSGAFGTGINDIKFINSNTGFACSSSGHIFSTTNGGSNWNAQSTSGSDLRSIHFINSTTGFTCGNFGNITYTTNGGANWPTISSVVTGSTLLSIAFSDVENGWSVGSSGTLIKTFDGSGTFDYSSVPQGKALNFDGADDYISLPGQLGQNLTTPAVTQFTIEYWFKGNNIQSAVRIQNGGNYIVSGWGSTGNPKHLISTEGGTNGINVGAAANDGNWHHVAMTWQKNTVNGFRSYLDGSLVDQRSTSNSNLPFVNTDVYIGCYQASSEFTSGSLDEVRIWTRALTQSEIAAGMFLERSSGAGLIASYHFNQGRSNVNNPAVTSLKDTSSNNYSGTLVNFTLSGTSSNWFAPGANLHLPANTITVGAIIEGYYNASTNFQSFSDTMRVYLCSDISPYNNIDSAKQVIDSVSHKGTFTFNNAAPGNYYIKLIHRNSIETWSLSPENFLDTLTYDFTLFQTRAYGQNLKQVDVSPTRFAIFGGDVNRDDAVDLTDIITVFNDANAFVSGYAQSDLTGDFFVDLSDLTIAFNNSNAFVGVIKP